jgi:hypothetical protein
MAGQGELLDNRDCWTTMTAGHGQLLGNTDHGSGRQEHHRTGGNDNRHPHTIHMAQNDR